MFPNLVICEHCDSVYHRLPLGDGEVARCERCSASLRCGNRLDIDRWLALTLTAAVMFVIANTCPVVRISLHGLRNEATLWQAVMALVHGAASPIALPVAMSIVVAPGLQIALLAWVLLHARKGRRAPGFAAAMNTLGFIRPWTMVEVGMLGILVAIIKLSSIVRVAPGPGIWAMACLMVLISLIGSSDIRWLWWGATTPSSEDEKLR